jgi:hypothetical protein
MKQKRTSPGDILRTFPEVERPAELGTFILDTLLREGETLSKFYKDLYHELSKSLPKTKDRDLCHPYSDAEKRAALAKEGNMHYLDDELQKIKKHVRHIHDEWSDVCIGAALNPKRSGPTQHRAITSLAGKFAAGPPDLIFMSNDETQSIKASFAYDAFFKPDKADYFAFAMAFGSLCSIKARAKGHVAMTAAFGDCMSIPLSMVRVIAAVVERDSIIVPWEGGEGSCSQ